MKEMKERLCRRQCVVQKKQLLKQTCRSRAVRRGKGKGSSIIKQLQQLDPQFADAVERADIFYLIPPLKWRLQPHAGFLSSMRHS